MPQLWKVVGGAGKGGITVRDSEDPESAQRWCLDEDGDEMVHKLDTGAVVEEQILTELGRLSYKLVSGDGPLTGWVSVKHNGKDLLVKTDAEPSPAVSGIAESPAVLAAISSVQPEVEIRQEAASGAKELEIAADGLGASVLSAAAKVFVPGCYGPAVDKAMDPLAAQAQEVLTKAAKRGQVGESCETAEETEDDILSKLPWSHQQMLRGSFEDPSYPGEYQSYFVGTLKSFSNSKGFGFLSCSGASEHWGRDVFIHKNHVPTPWKLGQPVEFSIIVNAQLQPQACDCLWLPLLPQNRGYQAPMQVVAPVQSNHAITSDASRSSGIFGNGISGHALNTGAAPPDSPFPSPSIFSSNGPSGAPAAPPLQPSHCKQWQPLTPREETAAPPLMPTVAAPPVLPEKLEWYPPPPTYAGSTYEDVPAAPAGRSINLESSLPATAPLEVPGAQVDRARYLGSLKSYSSEKNYGFLTCIDVPTTEKRDVFFEKPPDQSLCIAQSVEFSLVFNARGQPQASNIDWDPIPLQPLASLKLLETHPSGARAFAASTLEKIKRLLCLMNSNDMDTAITSAIDLQGGSKAADREDPDVDYVIFVLDRLGTTTHSAMVIKDFTKMLLLLMVSKMLRKLPDDSRTQKLAQWLTYMEKLAQWLFLLVETIDPKVDAVKGHIESVVGYVTSVLDENPYIPQQKSIRATLQQLQTTKATEARS